VSSPDLHKLPRSSSYSSCCPTKDPKSQFYVRIPPSKPKHAGRFCEFVQSTLLQDSANTLTHSEGGFCEYANSLWKILPVNARLLSKILRIRVFTLEYSASYARLLSKILWLRSFTLQDSASTLNSQSKIPRVRSFAQQDSANTLYVCNSKILRRGSFTVEYSVSNNNQCFLLKLFL
jgi:hypothetical protein